MTNTRYSYDQLGRLTGAAYENGQQIAYAYDGAGNRLSVTVSGGAAPVVAAAPVPAAPAARVASQPTVVGPMSAAAVLVPLNGPRANQPIMLGEQLHIGREADNDLALADVRVSRHHAIVQRQGDRYQITDLGSSNGTWLNGQRIAGTAMLQAGDTILLGDTQLRFVA